MAVKFLSTYEIFRNEIMSNHSITISKVASNQLMIFLFHLTFEVANRHQIAFIPTDLLQKFDVPFCLRLGKKAKTLLLPFLFSISLFHFAVKSSIFLWFSDDS